jgi:hypothetical protein
VAATRAGHACGSLFPLFSPVAVSPLFAFVRLCSPLFPFSTNQSQPIPTKLDSYSFCSPLLILLKLILLLLVLIPMMLIDDDD